jgi:hypothetical protein
MPTQPVRLKLLLQERHWQTYGTFRREYDRAANSVDPELSGGAPSRAQLYRWLSGDMKGLPYPYHCRVLEKMFPGWSAAQLFEPCSPQQDAPPSEDIYLESRQASMAELFKTIDASLADPGLASPEWGSSQHASPSRPNATHTKLIMLRV